MLRLLAYLRRFGCDTRGLAAIEFALISPLMLLSLLGAVELSNSMFADRKVTQATSTLADLVSQDTEITTAEKNIIFAAAAGVLASINPTGLHFRVTSIVADSKGVTKVGWSVVYNSGGGTAFAQMAGGSKITAPDGVVSANGSVIMAEAVVLYPSMVGGYIDGIDDLVADTPDGMTGTWTVQHTFYLKPRRSPTITYKP